EEVARALGLVYLPAIERNEFGTPLLHSVFAGVGRIARHRFLCYLNADLWLVSDLTTVLARIRLARFLVIARRIEFASTALLSLDELMANADRLVRGDLGRLGEPTAIDFLLFPRAPELLDLPSFAVGRPGWDNWFVYNALAHRYPVIDVTGQVHILHHEHDYDHVQGSRGKWSGPEGDRNRQLAGGWQNMFTILDASHVLTASGLRVARAREFVERRVDRLRLFAPGVFRLLLHWRLRYLYCYLLPMAGIRHMGTE
ncbi:MAG: hypothetical protein ACUVWX_02405, partial [Kiritimatiellia bacterium]